MEHICVRVCLCRALRPGAHSQRRSRSRFLGFIHEEVGGGGGGSKGMGRRAGGGGEGGGGQGYVATMEAVVEVACEVGGRGRHKTVLNLASVAEELH